jgi:hypothetical protein
MSLKIKIKLNQDYGSPKPFPKDSTQEFSFDEAMSLVEAGFGEQVIEPETEPAKADAKGGK